MEGEGEGVGERCERVRKSRDDEEEDEDGDDGDGGGMDPELLNGVTFKWLMRSFIQEGLTMARGV